MLFGVALSVFCMIFAQIGINCADVQDKLKVPIYPVLNGEMI